MLFLAALVQFLDMEFNYRAIGSFLILFPSSYWFGVYTNISFKWFQKVDIEAGGLEKILS